MIPMMRDWLVETIPEQIADLRGVLARWRPDVVATDLSLWGPIVVLPEARTDPGGAVLDVHGAADPGPARARRSDSGCRRPASAPGRIASPTLTRLTELAGRRICAAPWTRSARPTASGRWANRSTASARACRCTSSATSATSTTAATTCPESVHYVGNCIWYPRRGEPAARGWTRSRTEHPWVYVTESTARLRRPVPAAHGGRGVWPESRWS